MTVELSTLGATIKTAYEGEADTNAFTDAEQTKLAGALLADGTVPMSADLAMGSNQITGVADPTSAQDAATKGYSDAIAQGHKWKDQAAVAATGNITLSGEQTIDGELTSTDRVLAPSQTDATENGLWVSAAGAWTRATDADTGEEVFQSTLKIASGTVNGGRSFTNTNTSVPTLGVTNITYADLGSATSHNSTNGLQGGTSNEFYHLTSTEHGFLSGQDQALSTTDNVTFGNIAGTLTTAAQANVTSVGTLSSLTVSGDLAVDTTALFVNATSNRVGIGTSSPDTLLDVEDGTGSVTEVRIRNTGTASTDHAFARSIVPAGSGDPKTVYTIDAVGSWAIGLDNSDADNFKISASDELGTGNIITIESGGNMGFGTTTPDDYQHGGTVRVLEIESADAGVNSHSQLIVSTNANDASSAIGGVSAALPSSTDANKGVGFVSFVTESGNDAANPSCSISFGTRAAGDSDWGAKMSINGAGDVSIGVTTPLGQLHVDQNLTNGAQPTLYLDQADVSEEMIEFNTTIGTGNAIEAIGAKALTTTHFIKVTLPGALTRYIPCGTIA